MSDPTTRRGLFGASAAMLLLAAPAAGDAKARELDGELLATCAEFHRLDEAVRQTNAAFDQRPVEAHDALWDECSAGIWTDYNDVIRHLISLEPRTPEGLQAKARAAKAAFVNHVFVHDKGEDVSAGAGDEERLVISCLHAMAGRVA